MTAADVSREHVGALNLHRIRAGGWSGADAERALAHLAGCPDCERRLALLGQEQSDFENRISFDRFSAGVERARRVPGAVGTAHGPWSARAPRRLLTSLVSVGAVAAALVLVGHTLLQRSWSRGDREEAGVAGSSRTKGAVAGPRLEVFIAPALPRENPQRLAAADGVERLAPGERLRIGLAPGERHFYLAISIDDAGQVTPLFPEDGISAPVPERGGWQYLPGAFELTGTGHEQVRVILTDRRVDVAPLRPLAAAALAAAAGDLTRMPDLAVEGEQFHRTFLKP